MTDTPKIYFGGVLHWPNEPISILLSHSDCDGEIKWEDCEGIASALEKLLPSMKRADFDSGDNFYHQKTIQFIQGLILAFDEKENVDFH